MFNSILYSVSHTTYWTNCWPFVLKGVFRICLHENHLNEDEMKRSRSALVLTLTSAAISRRNKIHILFLQQSSLVKVFWLMQAQNEKTFVSFANPGGLNYSSKSKRTNVGGVMMPFKLTLK